MRKSLFYLKADNTAGREVAIGEIISETARIGQFEVDANGKPVRLVKVF